MLMLGCDGHLMPQRSRRSAIERLLEAVTEPIMVRDVQAVTVKTSTTSESKVWEIPLPPGGPVFGLNWLSA